jgi:hypothetical protein
MWLGDQTGTRSKHPNGFGSSAIVEALLGARADITQGVMETPMPCRLPSSLARYWGCRSNLVVKHDEGHTNCLISSLGSNSPRGKLTPNVLQCHSAHHHKNYLLASLIWNDLAAIGISAKFEFFGSFATLLDLLLLSLSPSVRSRHPHLFRGFHE